MSVLVAAQVLQTIYRETVTKLPIFQVNADHAYHAMLLRSLRPLFCSAGECLTVQGSSGNELCEYDAIRSNLPIRTRPVTYWSGPTVKFEPTWRWPDRQHDLVLADLIMRGRVEVLYLAGVSSDPLSEVSQRRTSASPEKQPDKTSKSLSTRKKEINEGGLKMIPVGSTKVCEVIGQVQRG